MEESTNILTSPASRMRSIGQKENARKTAYFRKLIAANFRKTWELKFIKEIPEVKYCAHEYNTPTSSPHTVSLHIRLLAKDGGTHDIYQDLGVMEKLDTVKNDFYQRIFDLIKSGDYEQTEQTNNS